MRYFIFLLTLLFMQCGNPVNQKDISDWQTPIPTNSFNSTPPIIYGNNVIVQIVDSLWALDLDSGDVNWKIKLQNGRAVTFTVPQYENYAFYCGKHEVYKVDVQNGIVEWIFPTSSRVDIRHLAIDSSSLYFGTSAGIFYEIDLVNGEMIRYHSLYGENIISAMPYGSNVYVTSFSPVDYTGHLTCLSNGEEVWSNPTSAIISKPAFWQNEVIVNEFPDETVVYNMTTGEELHRFDFVAHCQISPLVEEDFLYIGAAESLTKIDLPSKQILFSTNGGVRYDLVPTEDELYSKFGSSVRGYNKINGEMQDSFSPNGDEVISNPCYYEGMIYFVGGSYIYAYEP